MTVRRLALTVLLLVTTEAFAESLPIADYVAVLESIDTHLGTGDLEAAKAEAHAVLGAEIGWSKGTFIADSSVLQPIVEARTASGPHRARLLATIAELRRAAGLEAARTDRKLLERIAAEQQAPELPKGGEIKTTIEKDIPLLDRISNAFADMLGWIAEKLNRFLDWLFDLLPRTRSGAPMITPGLRWIVIVVVLSIVLLVAWLAFDVIRRSRAAAPSDVQAGTALSPGRDEDPLSRGATEWERYASELARSGRYREAIRAWYHAVLVTCYSAGILHFRKGRTNWEYVASLSPSLAWRPDVIELTRHFEQEWYGADQSSEEAFEGCSERARRVLDALHRDMRGAA